MALNPDAKEISVKEVAFWLGVTEMRVRHLIQRERLPATKEGKGYKIKVADLRLVEIRPIGRPSKKMLTLRDAMKNAIDQKSMDIAYESLRRAAAARSLD